MNIRHVFSVFIVHVLCGCAPSACPQTKPSWFSSRKGKFADKYKKNWEKTKYQRKAFISCMEKHSVKLRIFSQLLELANINHFHHCILSRAIISAKPKADIVFFFS